MCRLTAEQLMLVLLLGGLVEHAHMTSSVFGELSETELLQLKDVEITEEEKNAELQKALEWFDNDEAKMETEDATKKGGCMIS